MGNFPTPVDGRFPIAFSCARSKLSVRAMEVRMIDEKNKFFEYGYSWEKEVQSRGYYAYPANDKGVVITKFNEDDYYSQFHTKRSSCQTS